MEKIFLKELTSHHYIPTTCGQPVERFNDWAAIDIELAAIIYQSLSFRESLLRELMSSIIMAAFDYAID